MEKHLVQRGEYRWKRHPCRHQTMGQQNPASCPNYCNKMHVTYFFVNFPPIYPARSALGCTVDSWQEYRHRSAFNSSRCAVFLATLGQTPTNLESAHGSAGCRQRHQRRNTRGFSSGDCHEAGNQAGKMKQAGKCGVDARSYSAPALTRQ